MELPFLAPALAGFVRRAAAGSDARVGRTLIRDVHGELKWEQSPAMRKTLRLGLGIVLVIIGFIGGFIPILQGWLFMIPGLIILADYFPPVRRLLNWAKNRARKAGIHFHDPDGDKEAGGKPPRSEPPQS